MKRVVLDIDGVILKGGALIPGAAAAIARLHKHHIPYCFVTNGGGVLESVKAAELSHKINLPVPPQQVVLCHTPMQRLTAEFGREKVLVLGKLSCLEVRKSLYRAQYYIYFDDDYINSIESFASDANDVIFDGKCRLPSSTVSRTWLVSSSYTQSTRIFIHAEQRRRVSSFPMGQQETICSHCEKLKQL